MRHLEVITHFAEDDPDFTSDYTGMTVKLDGEIVAEYGDAYHDRGREKAAGFVDGFRAALGESQVTVVETNVADGIV